MLVKKKDMINRFAKNKIVYNVTQLMVVYHMEIYKVSECLSLLRKQGISNAYDEAWG